MTEKPRSFLRLSLMCAFVVVPILVATPALSAAAAKSWDLAKIEGRDYVSVESVKQFYRFTKLTRSGASIVLENSKLEMKLKVGGNECLMNNVKFIFSHPVAALGNKVYVSRIDLAKLVDPVLRPSFIKNAGDFRTVILDPGHGGKDPGATNAYGTEANYNLKLAGSVKTRLEAQGYKVLMTRESNRYLTLQERVNFANAVKERAIFISIHFNSGGRAAARGVETFTLSPPGVSHYGRDFRMDDNQSQAGNAHDSANIALATTVHGMALRHLGKNTLDRGIKRARFSVLSGVRHPAILLEGGFLSHPYEARLIESPAYQNALANGLVEAVTRYRRAVTHRPAAAQKK